MGDSMMRFFAVTPRMIIGPNNAGVMIEPGSNLKACAHLRSATF
jgi:hypothetical protein